MEIDPVDETWATWVLERTNIHVRVRSAHNWNIEAGASKRKDQIKKHSSKTQWQRKERQKQGRCWLWRLLQKAGLMQVGLQPKLWHPPTASMQLESLLPWPVTPLWIISKTTGNIAPTLVMELHQTGAKVLVRHCVLCGLELFATSSKVHYEFMSPWSGVRIWTKRFCSEFKSCW